MDGWMGNGMFLFFQRWTFFSLCELEVLLNSSLLIAATTCLFARVALRLSLFSFVNVNEKNELISTNFFSTNQRLSNTRWFFLSVIWQQKEKKKLIICKPTYNLSPSQMHTHTHTCSKSNKKYYFSWIYNQLPLNAHLMTLDDLFNSTILLKSSTHTHHSIKMINIYTLSVCVYLTCLILTNEPARVSKVNQESRLPRVFLDTHVFDTQVDFKSRGLKKRLVRSVGM